MDPVRMKNVTEIMPMYEKYRTDGTRPSMLSFEKKYHIEYRNRYPPEDPADRYDLHHQR